MGCYKAPDDIDFDFGELWSITELIWEACPDDDRLWGSNINITLAPIFNYTLALTQNACQAITGGNNGWTIYPTRDILNRLTVWKLPLLQLVAQFPRPPLNISVETFVIVHLLGDPIDTIWSLLHKLWICEKRARDWRKRQREGNEWKGLALIHISYDEWMPKVDEIDLEEQL